MSTLYRFGVSLEKNLIDAFDRAIGEDGYPNRSEAIRDLIRERLARKGQDGNLPIAGAIVMTYDHHKRDLAERLMEIQHDFFENIISTQHVHLDRENCMEIIAVRGLARDVARLASTLKSLIGVEHLEVSVSSYGLVGEGADTAVHGHAHHRHEHGGAHRHPPPRAHPHPHDGDRGR
jgi:CopG family nickel-responsive transcriptional regulator